ncbi:MAG: hypothetical protein M0R17_09150 [Candidatus Omnitrophica bacterium]|jgi:hypothetical protein|nr:hypothetical protein [Candidatus Omnitrophota bacterium]
MEPNKKEKLKIPIDDDITALINVAFNKALKGAANYSDINARGEIELNSGWLGEHTTDCGMSSDSYDYLLENGMIVNNLCTFYIRWYRDSICMNDWKKISKLANFYAIDIELPYDYKKQN